VLARRGHVGFVARWSPVAFACWCLLALTGCDDSGSFLCLDDAECGQSGVCEDNGSCSFVDSNCESGRRYGEFASDRVAEVCVEPDSEADSDSEPGSAPSAEPTDEVPASGVCAQAASCELCLACTVVEAPCAQHVLTCSTNDACVDALTCAQACLAFGDCDDCCAAAGDEDRDLIVALNACQVSECGALCGEARAPECSSK